MHNVYCRLRDYIDLWQYINFLKVFPIQAASPTHLIPKESVSTHFFCADLYYSLTLDTTSVQVTFASLLMITYLAKAKYFVIEVVTIV